jgi:hypothetical protein
MFQWNLFFGNKYFYGFWKNICFYFQFFLILNGGEAEKLIINFILMVVLGLFELLEETTVPKLVCTNLIL